ncbi:MAG: single-stranded DNA-binding protein [Deltaproteobacteria bacterium]|nr:single-stranded DNA-binding protein [Deltaproteobacteria bacterium]
MASLNKVQLIGNLGKDPELSYTQDGLGILKFTLATGEVYSDKNGEKTEKTTWHNVVLFGKLAETLANYLSKGKQVYVEGKIRNSDYTDKEGIKRYRTDIVANSIIMLGNRGQGGDIDMQTDQRSSSSGSSKSYNQDSASGKGRSMNQNNNMDYEQTGQSLDNSSDDEDVPF